MVRCRARGQRSWIRRCAAVLALSSAACRDPVAPAGDGDTSTGSGAETWTHDHDSSDASTATDASSGTTTAGTGQAAVEPVELCPSSALPRVGIDTHVRITLPGAATPELLSPSPITISCGKVPIAGTISVGPGQVVFEPASALPSNSNCNVILAPDVMTVDGAPVAEVSWSFATGSEPGVEFDFRAPVDLSDGHGLDAQLAEAEGDDVVLTWNVPRMTVARSTDRGEHFELSTFDRRSSGVSAADLQLQDGVAHLVWQDGGDVYYSRSGVGLGEMSEPLPLTASPYQMDSSLPSVTTDGTEFVIVSWLETCIFGRMCEPDAPGVYMQRSEDGGVTFAEPVRIVGSTTAEGFMTSGPELGWVDGGLFGVWGIDGAIEFLDLEGGLTSIEQIESAFTFPLERTHEGEVAALLGLANEVRLVHARGRDADSIDPPLSLVQSAAEYFVATADVVDDVVAVVVGEGAMFSVQGSRLVLSTDGGQTMLGPQSLDDLVLDGSERDPNRFVPLVTIADDQRAHLVWSHFDDDAGYSVRYTHGDRIDPCGMRAG